MKKKLIWGSIIFLIPSILIATVISVSTPEHEIENATVIAMGKAFIFNSNVYLKPEKIFKGELELGKTYKFRGPPADDKSKDIGLTPEK